MAFIEQPARPYEKRALGLIMRIAERRGMIGAPAANRRLVADLDFADEEIDRGLELLVTPDGLTVGGTADPALLVDGRRIGRLVLEDMIEIDNGGRWSLTDKGRALSNLLDEYADPKYQWRVLSGRRRVRDAACPGEGAS